MNDRAFVILLVVLWVLPVGLALWGYLIRQVLAWYEDWKLDRRL